ncbi:unnamed protein product [Tuber aestivum]|uniref:Uncharacterized protein n=1 Tax=Tuber aestivum TaxID=59557 RepID=A0A292PTE9_9PEZI|nr:unnamed protein product [Tuber aestivum]
MATRSTHHRSKSADVRRTLFRSLSRSTANTGMDNASTATSSSASSGLGGGGGGGEEDDSVGNVSGSESIIVRKSDGTFDIEAPPVVGIHEHLGLQEIERELVEQHRAVGRHNVDITKRLPGISSLDLRSPCPSLMFVLRTSANEGPVVATGQLDVRGGG